MLKGHFISIPRRVNKSIIHSNCTQSKHSYLIEQWDYKTDRILKSNRIDEGGCTQISIDDVLHFTIFTDFIRFLLYSIKIHPSNCRNLSLLNLLFECIVTYFPFLCRTTLIQIFA